MSGGIRRVARKRVRRCRTLRLLLKCSAVTNRLKSLLKRIVGDTVLNGVIDLRSSASAAASACS